MHKVLFEWSVVETDAVQEEINISKKQQDFSTVTLGKIVFARDLFCQILSFCDTLSKSRLIQVNNELFHFVTHTDENFKLNYLLCVFSSAKLPSHLFLPSVDYILAQRFNLCTMGKQKRGEQNWTVLTRLIKEMPKYFNEAQGQQVVLTLMKYLPWQVTPLLLHKYSQVATMAKNGAKLMALKQKWKDVAQVLKIVPNMEDYANCVLVEFQSDFRVVGHLIMPEEFDEQSALTIYRASCKKGELPAMNIELKNEELILYLLHIDQVTSTTTINASLLQSMDFVRTAVLVNPIILLYCSQSFKNDDSLINFAVKSGIISVLLYASIRIQHMHVNDYARAVARDANYKIPVEWYDNEIVMKAHVHANSNNFVLASQRLQNLERFALSAVSSSCKIFPQLASHWQSNIIVVNAMLKNNLEGIVFVPESVIKSSIKLAEIRDAYKDFSTTHSHIATGFGLNFVEYATRIAKLDL